MRNGIEVKIDLQGIDGAGELELRVLIGLLSVIIFFSISLANLEDYIIISFS